MDKEQIIKSLKDCKEAKSFSLCLHCGNCDVLIENALALIEELVKENEDLKYDIDSSAILLKKQREESRIEHQNQMRMLDEIYDGIIQLKVNIVRKIQEDVAIYFGTYTDKDEVKVSDVIRLINRISEEILEEGNG